MAQVLQTSCDYKIKTQTNGSITLDTSEVIVTGDLRVEGETVTVNVTNLDVEDNIIRLNKGETGNGVTEGFAGIEVDRGFSDSPTNTDTNPLPTFWFNETSSAWEIVTQTDTTYSYNESYLKVRKILTNDFTDGGNLTLIGTGTGVVSVAGTTNYEENVAQDDDIPNKRYVDLAIANREPDNKIQRDNTYVLVQDVDGGASGNALMAVSDNSLSNPGANYSVNDEVILVGGTARRDMRIRVDSITPGGLIDTYTVLDNGLYSELPLSNNNIATDTNGSGTGATFDVYWTVSDVEIVNPGDDYETASVTFTDGIDLGAGPLLAIGTVNIDLDEFSETYRQVLTVSISDGGKYDALPTISFSSGLNPDLTESQVSVVVEGTQSTVFYEDRVQLEGLEFSNNEITNNLTDSNIVLNTTGVAAVEINRALKLDNSSSALDFMTGGALVFSKTEETDLNPQTTGGTGIFYNSKKQSLVWDEWVTNNPVSQNNPSNLATYPVMNELISKHKALVMSMLF